MTSFIMSLRSVKVRRSTRTAMATIKRNPVNPMILSLSSPLSIKRIPASRAGRSAKDPPIQKTRFSGPALTERKSDEIVPVNAIS